MLLLLAVFVVEHHSQSQTHMFLKIFSFHQMLKKEISYEENCFLSQHNFYLQPELRSAYRSAAVMFIRCQDRVPRQRTSNLYAVLLNARSLRNKLTDLQASIYSNDVDILVITETWFTPAILDHEVLPSGYSVYRRDREEDRRGGGVLIAIKDNIPSIRPRDKDKQKTNCELVVVEVNPTRANKFFIYGFYRPPSTIGEYLLELKQHPSYEELNSTPLFLCSDFNFPDINWNNKAAPGLENLPNMFCDIVSDTFLTQMNDSPAARITHR